MSSNRIVRITLCLIFLTLHLSPFVWAGTNAWTVDGPEGGQLVSLAVHPQTPSTVFAAARDGGFWRSLDGGESWSLMMDDLSDFNAQAVALHPDDPTVLFGVTNSRLVRSVALGPWETVSDELEGGIFAFSGALHFDAVDADTLYLGSFNNGVLKSTDGGQTWTVLGPEGASSALFVAQDPSDPAVIYTGGFATHLFRSADSGATWTDLGPISDNTDINGLAVDPLDGNRLWAATRNGLFRSLDGGTTWQNRDASLGNHNMLMVRFDPRDPQTLFAGSRFGLGLARSSDRGETWMVQELDRQASAVADIAFGAAGSTILYLAVDGGGGVYRSVDDGGAWQWMSAGLSAATVTGLAIDPLSGTVLAVSAGSGVFRRDGIGDWQPLLNSPRDGYCCLDIVAAPGQANTFYASGNRGVYRTDDGGATWQSRSTGLPPFITGDNLVVDPADAQRLYLSEFGGVYSSIDGGGLWELSAEGLPAEEFVSDVAVDPGDSQVLYASTSDRLYRSGDGGASWASTTGDTALDFSPFAVSVNPVDSANLIVGTASDGVLRSLDGGVTWEDVGFSGSSFVRDVEFGALGVATAVTFRGLWRTSGIRGTFWSPVGELDAVRGAVFAAAVEGGPVTTYFVGTNGGSAWSLTRGCIASDTVLCIDDLPGNRRFAISMDFQTVQGGPQSGAAEVTVLEELGIRQGGVFSFFGRQNPEVLVKVLNGCAFNDRYWVFAAATTNVGYTLTVLDTGTGQSRIYTNEDGTIATTVTDTDALATCAQPAGSGSTVPTQDVQSELDSAKGSLPSIAQLPPSKGNPGPCQADGNTLCIDDEPGDQRFAVRLRYDTVLGDGASGDAMATSLTSLGVTDGGILSFFDVANPEVLIKVINGCDFNGHYWVFYAAATNLGFRVEVEDTSTGTVWDSTNPDGLPAVTITDTSAMATCDG